MPPLAADDAVSLFLARAEASGATIELVGRRATRPSPTSAPASTGCPWPSSSPRPVPERSRSPRSPARLDDRFRLLTGGSRTALPRQQTLRAVVDWSYELLFDDEQRVFERLSVFPGGCDLATAEAVCADDAIDAADIADHVQALVDKSLVVAVPVGGGVRFTQLQTLAQYGRERLDRAGRRGAHPRRDGPALRPALLAQRRGVHR